MVPDMKQILFFTLAMFMVQPTAAVADQCKDTACIKVYTDDNQIIIEARKGDQRHKKTISQTPKPTKKPVVPTATQPKAVPLFFPPTAVAKSTAAKSTAIKPPVKKPSVKRPYKPRIKKTVARVNLSDRLIKLVPTAGVAYQPEFEPLVNVPVYFWSDLPSFFHSRVDIIGEIVDVALRPSFTWSFGDGSTLSTTDNGAAYPKGQILHTYSRPGTYVISLLTTWNGSFTHNAQARAVTGTIKKISAATITVVAAPTYFNG